MINQTALSLMKCFPRSFINSNGEFIAHEKANEYFILNNCKTDLEVKCKVLEWLSRGASKTEPFNTKKKNEEFNNFMLDGINKFLNTNFTKEQMRIIYQKLGNAVKRNLTIDFIFSDYDMNFLIAEGRE